MTYFVSEKFLTWDVLPKQSIYLSNIKRCMLRVKAVNAGGVATSGLEMTQNAMHLSWSAAEVDEKLHAIMHGIHAQCVKYGTEPDGYINYVKGANIAGFMKVAHAMMGQGVI